MQFIDTVTNTNARLITENMAQPKSEETIRLSSARRFRKFEASALAFSTSNQNRRGGSGGGI